MTFLLIGGKELRFLFQSLVRIPRIIPIIVLLGSRYICKTMDRMINRRLVWYLESHKLLTNQDVARLIILQDLKHFAGKLSSIINTLFFLFFDLEKAYDSTWKYGIMKDLQTINSITQFLKPGADCSLYVDNFQVCYISSNMSIIERHLQRCLNKFQQWTIDNGFQFSKTKTVCMHICQKRGLHLYPHLCLTNVQFQCWRRPNLCGLYLTRGYPLIS